MPRFKLDAGRTVPFAVRVNAATKLVFPPDAVVEVATELAGALRPYLGEYLSAEPDPPPAPKPKAAVRRYSTKKKSE